MHRSPSQLFRPHVWLCALGLSALNTAWAQTAPPLVLNEAVRAAAAWHPAVRNASGQLLQADESVAAARSGYYPQVRAGINSELRNREIDAYGSRRIHQASVSVSQMLYDFGKVSGSVRLAEAGVDTARAQVLKSVDDVVREAALAWVELSRHQALSAIANEQIEGVQALSNLASEREQKGASTRSDSLQAQSRVDSARAVAVNSEAQVLRWQFNLMNLTGVRTPRPAQGPFPELLLGACEANSGEAAPWPPSVLRAQAQLEEARAAHRLSKSETLPTLSLDASAARGINRASRIEGSNGIDTSVNFNFSAPLYEGGRGQARERAALHAISVAESALEQAQLQARQSLQDAQSQTAGQRGKAPVLEQRIDSIRRTRDLYREQYLQLGTRSLLDLLNAEQEYHSARFEAAESAHEVQRLAVECLYQSGRLRDAFAVEVAQPRSGELP